MKKLLIGLLALGSISSFAVCEISGATRLDKKGNLEVDFIHSYGDTTLGRCMKIGNEELDKTVVLDDGVDYQVRFVKFKFEGKYQNAEGLLQDKY